MLQLDDIPLVIESYGSDKKRFSYFLDNGLRLFKHSKKQRQFASFFDAFQVAIQFVQFKDSTEFSMIFIVGHFSTSRFSRNS